MNTRYSRLLLAFLFTIIAASQMRAEEHRNWKDNTGKFNIVGKYLGLEDAHIETQQSGRERNDRVLIQKQDGSVVKVPLQKLSKSDKQYVLEKIAGTVSPSSKIKIEIDKGSIRVNGQILPAKPEKTDLVKVFGKPRLWPNAADDERGRRKYPLWNPWPHLVWDEYGISARAPSKVWMLRVYLTKDPRRDVADDPASGYDPKGIYSGDLVVEGVNVGRHTSEDEISRAKLRPFNRKKIYWINNSKPKIVLYGGVEDPFKPPTWRRVDIDFSKR